MIFWLSFFTIYGQPHPFRIHYQFARDTPEIFKQYAKTVSSTMSKLVHVIEAPEFIMPMPIDFFVIGNRLQFNPLAHELPKGPISADLIILFDMQDCCDDDHKCGYVSDSQVLMKDVLGRPILGIARFCSELISNLIEDNNKGLAKMYQETFRISAFDNSLLTKLAKIPATSDMFVLNSPEVTKQVRAYYDCPYLLGMPVSNHFWAEESGLVDDVMMLRTRNHVYVSPMTLAVLKDSGWYHVNYNLNESRPLEYLGCGFAPPTIRYPTHAYHLNHNGKQYVFSFRLNGDVPCIFLYQVLEKLPKPILETEYFFAWDNRIVALSENWKKFWPHEVYFDPKGFLWLK